MKNLHLILSSVVLVPIALVYGIAHNELLPLFFNFDSRSVDTNNILRATMGLYFGVVALLITGIFKNRYWEAATLINIVFMFGLAAGRLISFIADGTPSSVLVIGFFVECFLGALAYFNWRKYKAR